MKIKISQLRRIIREEYRRARLVEEIDTSDEPLDELEKPTANEYETVVPEGEDEDDDDILLGDDY